MSLFFLTYGFTSTISIVYSQVSLGAYFYTSIFLCQIGSSPGFEDGEFESAKLLRPAASFYDAAEDCLYFVDSEVCINFWIWLHPILILYANYHLFHAIFDLFVFCGYPQLRIMPSFFFHRGKNHAIRRADLERRVVETIFPSCYNKKKTNQTNQIWTWIMDKLGFGSDAGTKPQEFDGQPLLFPWHLLNSDDGCLLVINRRYRPIHLIYCSQNIFEI